MPSPGDCLLIVAGFSDMRYPLTMTLLAVSCAAATQAPPAASTASARTSTCVSLVEIGPRVSGTPANVATRQYIISTLRRDGYQGHRAAVRGTNTAGHRGNGQRCGDPPWFAARTHHPGQPFRHEAFPRVHASSAQAMAARARRALLELARVLKDRPRTFTLELLFLDGEEAVVEWGPTDSTYGSRHYVQAARAANTLSSIKALVLLDMIGDTQLNIRRESQSTPWLTDIVWSTARRLGYQRQFLPRPHQSRTTTCPFSRPAYRRSTSSTSTTRPGTPRPTRWTTSAPGACRLSVMSCSRRCRISNSAWLVNSHTRDTEAQKRGTFLDNFRDSAPTSITGKQRPESLPLSGPSRTPSPF